MRKKNLYQNAGINNQAEFYGELYASEELLHPDYFHALERFHIRWARTMWIFDNVAAGSTLLDLGSGAGLLALLKRKGVKLLGVDLSERCAASTRRNGYDLACASDLKTLPFHNATFDYVVSLDVMGHIEFDDKDSVLAEIRRVLKPHGVTLHGIETMNTQRRKDYDEMNDSELKRFVQIDGHVGMEPEKEIKARFARFFAHVQAEPRFSICQSSEELVKQADEYGVALCDDDLLDYLRNLSHDERRAFDMAMGYVFQQISDSHIRLPPSEYLFLKASNSALSSFYNEHVSRSSLTRLAPACADSQLSLNETTKAIFDGGWYSAENFPPIGRWMGRRAKIRFFAEPASTLSLIMVTHIPDVNSRPLRVEVSLNNALQQSLVFADNEPRQIEVRLAQVPVEKRQGTCEYELQIEADRTWQPKPRNHRAKNDQALDDREISVAVFDIKLLR